MTSMRIGAVLLLLTAVAAADPPAVDVGGFIGGAWTNVYSNECHHLLRAPLAPADCESSPAPGGQGSVLGGYGHARVLPMVHLEADVTYAQKGYGNGTGVVELHYLETPLLVRFDPLADHSRARAFLLGGIAPAVLLACRTRPGSCEGQPFAPRRRVDLSAVFGAGVGWQLELGTIELQLRFVRGLLDVDGEESTKSVNRATYVVVGFGRNL